MHTSEFKHFKKLACAADSRGSKKNGPGGSNIDKNCDSQKDGQKYRQSDCRSNNIYGAFDRRVKHVGGLEIFVLFLFLEFLNDLFDVGDPVFLADQKAIWRIDYYQVFKADCSHDFVGTIGIN